MGEEKLVRAKIASDRFRLDRDMDGTAEMSLLELEDEIDLMMNFIEDKIGQLQDVRSGPLAEARAELLKLRSHVDIVQLAHAEIRQHVAEARAKQYAGCT